MVFKKQEDLKEPKYKKLKIWNTGWETIDIGSPPTGQAVVNEVKNIFICSSLIPILYNKFIKSNNKDGEILLNK